MYVFPSWRYHADGRAVIVETPQEEEALGPGWAMTPAAFNAPAVSSEPVPAPEPEPEPVAIEPEITQPRKRGRKPSLDVSDESVEE